MSTTAAPPPPRSPAAPIANAPTTPAREPAVSTAPSFAPSRPGAAAPADPSMLPPSSITNIASLFFTHAGGPNANAQRDGSVAPSEGSHFSEPGPLAVARIPPSGMGLTMSKGMGQGQQGIMHVQVNAQARYMMSRPAGNMQQGMSMGEQAKGLQVTVNERYHNDKPHQRPDMVPSSQDEPEIEDPDEIDGNTAPSREAAAHGHWARSTAHQKSQQDADAAFHEHVQYDQIDERLDADYDDMGDGFAHPPPHDAPHQNSVPIQHQQHAQQQVYEQVHDGQAYELDDSEDEQFVLHQHQQQGRHLNDWHQASLANQGFPAQPMQRADLAPGQTQAHSPGASFASEKARGQFRPPMPGAQVLASNSFVPPTLIKPDASRVQAAPRHPAHQVERVSSRDLHQAQVRPQAVHHDHGQAPPQIQAHQAQQQSLQRQGHQAGAQARNDVHVTTQTVGGRSRLIKRAGSNLKRSADDAFGVEDLQDENDQAEEPFEFDPTNDLQVFDYEKELVQEWNAIQSDVPAFLREFNKTIMKHCFRSMLEVAKLFHKLNRDAGEDLEEGVKKIQKEEADQREKREIILGFQKSMREVAMKLSQFGQNMTGASRALGSRNGSRANLP